MTKPCPVCLGTAWCDDDTIDGLLREGEWTRDAILLSALSHVMEEMRFWRGKSSGFVLCDALCGFGCDCRCNRPDGHIQDWHDFGVGTPGPYGHLEPKAGAAHDRWGHGRVNCPQVTVDEHEAERAAERARDYEFVPQPAEHEHLPTVTDMDRWGGRMVPTGDSATCRTCGALITLLDDRTWHTLTDPDPVVEVTTAQEWLDHRPELERELDAKLAAMVRAGLDEGLNLESLGIREWYEGLGSTGASFPMVLPSEGRPYVPPSRWERWQHRPRRRIRWWLYYKLKADLGEVDDW